MAILRIDENRCTGCEICIDSCPDNCIGFDQQRRLAYVEYFGDCMHCYLCLLDCPEDCIDFTPHRSRPIPLPW